MTDQSNMQKMHKPSDPESNVQKMHIPAEWVQIAEAAVKDVPMSDPISPELHDLRRRNGIRLILSAAIPLIRREAALDQIASEGQWYDLTAERDRYREALKEIGSYGQGYADALTHASRIARQALKGEA